MKKFFYSLVMMAISMMTFVSCSSDDDSVSSKDMIGGVLCEFSQDALDCFNIKMTAKGPNGVSYGSYNINTMTAYETDKNGVKKILVEFTVKDFPVNIDFEVACSKKPSELVKDQNYTFTYGCTVGAYKEKGQGVSKLNASSNAYRISNPGEKWAVITETGKTLYEDFVKDICNLSTTINK